MSKSLFKHYNIFPDPILCCRPSHKAGTYRELRDQPEDNKGCLLSILTMTNTDEWFVQTKSQVKTRLLGMCSMILDLYCPFYLPYIWIKTALLTCNLCMFSIYSNCFIYLTLKSLVKCNPFLTLKRIIKKSRPMHYMIFN